MSERNELELRIMLANNAFSQLAHICPERSYQKCEHPLYSMTRVTPDCHVNQCPLLGKKQ